MLSLPLIVQEIEILIAMLPQKSPIKRSRVKATGKAQHVSKFPQQIDLDRIEKHVGGGWLVACPTLIMKRFL
jgi:hypothetical protein